MDNGVKLPDPDLALLGERLIALRMIRQPSGTAAKRFTRQVCEMAPEALSERQRAYVEIICWTYRRQLPARLVPATKPAQLPPA